MKTVIQNAREKHIPIKYSKYHKHKHKKSPWVTNGILKSIKFRDKLYKRIRLPPVNHPFYNINEINVSTYRPNRITKQNIRIAKQFYYYKCFDKYKTDIKNSWKTIC